MSCRRELNHVGRTTYMGYARIVPCVAIAMATRFRPFIWRANESVFLRSPWTSRIGPSWASESSRGSLSRTDGELSDAVTLPITQELRQKSTDIGTQLPEEGRFCIENMSLMSLGLASLIRRRGMWAHCIVCGARVIW